MACPIDDTVIYDVDGDEQELDDAFRTSVFSDCEDEPAEFPASNDVKRAWCFTINNPKFGVQHYQTRWEQKSNRIRYVIMQQEAGKNGTPHYQGYAEFKTPVRLRQAQNLITPEGEDDDLQEWMPRAAFENRIGMSIHEYFCAE